MKGFLILLFPAFFCYAQSSVIGKWKTVDESTGEEKSIIEIFERNGKMFGKVVKIFTDVDPDPVCKECPRDDPRFGKKIIGMEIMTDLEKSGNEYSGGSILDPQDGKIYRCKIWIAESSLRVRGYWGPFFRTQTWKRVH